MTAPRRVSDLTVDELRELVRAVIREEMAPRSKKRPAAKRPDARLLEATRAELVRRGLLSSTGR